METKSEAEMLEFGKKFAESITLPSVIELVGDVGAGKTTFTRGLAKGLDVKEDITSPSFTISKRYHFKKDGKDCTLVHYDFYRLPDPGIMREEIAETMSDPNSLVVIEWGESVASLLPKKHQIVEIKLKDDGSRECLSRP